MISIQGLKVEFGSQVLFENISYVVNKRDKIALVGKNGAGKTTMLRIITVCHILLYDFLFGDTVAQGLVLTF